LTEWTLQFLRPWWLLALLPWIVALVFAFRKDKRGSMWEKVVDPSLQPYVIESAQEGVSRGRWFVLFGWLFALLLLSGPVWQKQDVPVYKGQQAQVILFDLSRSMYSDDIKPSRLARARFKLTDLLEQASGLQIALIAFAERPYVVSPLSDDANTIASFVESLDPAIMPAQGSRIDLAIEQGIALLSQAGVVNGQLVLITDSEVNASDITMAATVKSAGHVMSVVGVGTRNGAPLRGEDGRFLQDASGAIVIPRLNESALATLANTAGGIYSQLSSDNKDLRALQSMQTQIVIDRENSDQPALDEYWIEYGPYLTLILLLMALWFFRRGVIW